MVQSLFCCLIMVKHAYLNRPPKSGRSQNECKLILLFSLLWCMLKGINGMKKSIEKKANVKR